MLKIKKILNNNAVLLKKDGKDYIWLGTGIGFKKKAGESADIEKIEKVFVMQQNTTAERFSELLENIPLEYIKLSDDIIEMAKSKLSIEMSDTIYVSLTDHIDNSIKLHKEGINIGNQLSWEIKKFYSKEFDVGMKAIEMIKERTGVEFSQFEAGNIAMHLINAQLSTSFNQSEEALSIAKKIKDILSIIRMHNKVEIDEDSLAYDRFITHLRFFFKRLTRTNKQEETNLLLAHIIENYSAAYETVLLIEQYLKVTLNDDEKMYLSLHVQKLITNN